MKRLLDTFKEKNKKVMIGLSVAVALIIAGVIIANVSANNQPVAPQRNMAAIKDTKAESIEAASFKTKVNDTLSVIDKRLALVQKEMEKNAARNRDNKASLALNDLSKTIISFKTQAENSLLQSHEENQALAKKINALEDVIASLKGGEKQTQYLDKKALPFEVMAIDSVNEQAVLAIKYRYNHVALEKGESLAGWKVFDLDFSKQRAEFDDEKGAHVVLSLKDNSREEKSWA